MKHINDLNKLNIHIEKHLRKRFTLEPENMDQVYKALKNVNFEHFKPYYYMYEGKQQKPSFVKEFLPTYKLDFKVRSILFSSINELEISLRSRFLYYLTDKYGDYAIWDEKIFSNMEYHRQHVSAMKHILRSVQQTAMEATEFIDYKYASENINSFEALEHSQLGNLVYSILALPDSDLTELIERMYDYKIDLNDFKNWMMAILMLRNRLAHFQKIIDEDLMFTIDYSKYQLATKETQEQRNKKAFFNYLLVFKILMGKELYETLVNRIANYIHNEESLHKYGFPKNWKEF